MKATSYNALVTVIARKATFFLCPLPSLLQWSATTCLWWPEIYSNLCRQVSLQLHCIKLVSSPDCFPWVGQMSGILPISSWFQYFIDRFHYSCMPSSIGLKILEECSMQDELSRLFLLIFCVRLYQLNVGLSALLRGRLLLVQSTGWVCYFCLPDLVISTWLDQLPILPTHS